MMTSDSPSELRNPPTSASSKATEVASEVETIALALVQMVDRFIAVVVPLAQAFEEFLNRPVVQARIAEAARILQVAHDRIEAVEAPGYTPYFERLGHSGLSARLHALMIRSCAERLYRENQDKRVALSALHDLAGRSKWHPALARQVDRLRENCWDASFLDQAFREVGGSELKDEFMDLLRGTCGGDYAGGPRLIEIAARIAPYAPSPRGRPMEFDTVLHQMFLRWRADSGGRKGYTYGLLQDGHDARDDFIDEATAATRIELMRPSFNPVAARRAERRRLARVPTDETVVEGG